MAGRDESRPRRRVPAAIRRPANAALEGLLALLGRLPAGVGDALGRGLALLAWWTWRHWRQRALANLAVAFPERTPAERRAIARGTFRHLGRVAAEVNRAAAAGPRARAELCANHAELAAALRDDLAGGRGVVVAAAHLGNWLLASSTCATVAPTTALVTDYRDDWMSSRQTALRRRLDVGEARAVDWPLDLLRCLERNEIVTVVADVEERRRPGAFVPFFGRPTWFGTFAVELARVRGSPLRPVFLVRDGRAFRAVVLDRVPVPTRRQGAEGVAAATAALAAAIEAQVRRHPEQWTWMARRWRVKPGPDGRPA